MAAEGEDETQEETPTIDFPAVGGGRGSGQMQPNSLQPIVWHAIPTSFWEGMCHAFSAASIIDLTPGCGRLAAWAVTNKIPYVGMCATEAQKAHIAEFVLAGVKTGLLDPASKIYSPALKRDPEDPAPSPPIAVLEKPVSKAAFLAARVKAAGVAAGVAAVVVVAAKAKAQAGGGGGGGGDDGPTPKKAKAGGGGEANPAGELSPALMAMLAAVQAPVEAEGAGAEL